MPVVSTHCFANHRSGAGKTTLTFQVCATYAMAHPEQQVLVIDTTRDGDVSALLVGGVYETRGRDTLRRLLPIANTSQLFLRALTASTRSSLRRDAMQLAAGDAQMDDDASIVAKVVREMKQRRSLQSGSGEVEMESMSTGFDLAEFAVALKHVNPSLPQNLFLCPSGLDIQQPLSFSDSQRRHIISILKQSFRRSDDTWKIFIDTDAALIPHGDIMSNVHTAIALGVSDFCCLPLQADMADWYLVRSLLRDLRQLHNLGESHAKVQMVLWNGLSLRFNCGGRYSSSSGSTAKRKFTLTKQEQDVVRSLNKLVFEEAEQYPELFLHYDGKTTDIEDFSKKNSVCVANFSVAAVASKDVGVPIACMKPGTSDGVHMTYTLNQKTIDRCRGNLGEIVRAMDGSSPAAAGREPMDEQQRGSAMDDEAGGVGMELIGMPLKVAREVSRSWTMKEQRTLTGGTDRLLHHPITYNTRRKYALRPRPRAPAP